MKKLLLGSLLSLVMPLAQAYIEVDAELPDYQPVDGVAGNLSSVGSDTMANLMTLWAAEFQRRYPNVNVQIQAAGSSTAPPALTEATANIGPMSRLMKDSETSAFESKYGYKPSTVAVGIDALSVYVHKDNPLPGLTIQQLDAIFSATRRCGGSKQFTVWGDVGLDGAWENRDIQLFGRNSVSGTYGHFKNRVLCRGDFLNDVNEQPGSASVVQSVSTSINGIGYSGMGYRTASVRPLAVSTSADQPFVEATSDNAVDSLYPLSRYLYVYVNKSPETGLAPLEAEFIRFILSKQGQEIVLKDGYVPLPKRVIDRVLKSLDL
ncbi:MAG: hypothetical protein RL336_1801 [Pseudomonadota bacterium]|jgi:phosphate transport system substrate-binding protein